MERFGKRESEKHSFHRGIVFGTEERARVRIPVVELSFPVLNEKGKKAARDELLKPNRGERCFSSNFIEQSVQPAGALMCAALSAARCKLVVTTALLSSQVCVCVVDHQSRVGEREREKCEHTKQKSH